MTPRPTIDVRGLHKAFHDHVVLDGIDLAIPQGTVYGLLGPNGAGKTTVVNILSTLLAGDAGQARVAGHDVAAEPDAVRAAIGVTGQFSAVDNLLTGRENLRLMADLHHLGRAEGRGRVDELLGTFDLQDNADRPASTYSGGMRRRLDLAMTLVGRPRVIFLDEPTTGLDPRSRRDLWHLIEDLVAQGVTILLTSQYLDEADHLSDRIGVLDRGRIIAEGTPAQLKRTVPGGRITIALPDRASLAQALAALPEASADEGSLTVSLPSDGRVASLREVLDRLDAHGVTVETVASSTPDLDDVFLALTGSAASPTATDHEMETAR